MAKTQGYYPIRVAPFTGARIETERGEILLHDRAVAPFTGARIETSLLVVHVALPFMVAPFTGARIETAKKKPTASTGLSLPSRERGLKRS